MTENNEQTERTISESLDALHVIRCFGGIRPTASLLGVAVSTVQGWKERGVIPQSRREAVLRAAVQNGIDLVGDPAQGPKARAAKVTSQSNTPRVTSTEPLVAARVRTKNSTSGVAKLTLVLVATALIAVVTQPKWAPALFPDTLFASSSSVEAVADRISVLEERRDELSTGARATVTDKQLESLNDRIKALEEVSFADNSIESIAAKLLALADRLTVLEQSITEQRPGADLGALKSSMVTLNSEVAAVKAGLTLLKKASSEDGYSAAALVLAVGQLDAVISAGSPYAVALERLRKIGRGDLVVEDSTALLEVWAEDGVPPIAELRLRFKSVLSELTRPTESVSPDEGLWLRIRSQLIGLINVRRTGEIGDFSPITRSEQAVEKGDLEIAVAALEEVPEIHGEAVRSWVRHAKARLAADAVLTALNAHAVDALAKVGVAIE